MRFHHVFAPCAALALAVSCANVDAGGDGDGPQSTCAATQLDLAEQRIDSLNFTRGFELHANTDDFGGVSGLDWDADAQVLRAVTDQGLVFSISDLDGASVPTCSALTPVTDVHTASARYDKRYNDAEGLALLPSGSVAISFERDHRLTLSTPGLARSDVLRPKGEEALADNGGLEALTILKTGELIAAAEQPLLNGAHAVWLWDANTEGAYDKSAAPSFAIASPGTGFGLTGFATTPGGDVLVIFRRFVPVIGVTAIIGRIPAGDINAATSAAVITPVELARLRPRAGVPTDNYEGIAVAASSTDAQTRIWIVSDDNFNAIQRTLLLEFSLPALENAAD